MTGSAPRTVTGTVAGLVRVARPGNVVMAGIGVLVGALVVGGPVTSLAVALTALATMLVTAAGNALNDLTDLAIDAQAHPERPLPAGQVSRGAVLGLALVGFLVALALGSLVSWPVAGIVALAEGIVIGYELALKRRGWIGNLVVALLVALTFIAGGLAVGHLSASVAFLAGAALSANVAREVWKDAEDAAHDIGRSTIARRWGQTTARRTGQAATVLAIVLSPLPLLVGFGGWPFLAAVLVADAIFLASLAVPAPAKAQRLSKAGMVAALIAFTVGAIA